MLAYILTLGKSSANSRNWIYTGQIVMLVAEVSILLQEVKLPEWFLPTVTEVRAACVVWGGVGGVGGFGGVLVGKVATLITLTTLTTLTTPHITLHPPTSPHLPRITHHPRLTTRHDSTRLFGSCTASSLRT